MREIICATKNFDKKMAINSRNGIPMQDNLGRAEVMAVAVMKDTDEETGEIKEVGVLVTEESDYLTCISATVIDVLPDLVEFVDAEEIVSVNISSRKSKGGRDFLTLTIL